MLSVRIGLIFDLSEVFWSFQMGVCLVIVTLLDNILGFDPNVLKIDYILKFMVTCLNFCVNIIGFVGH